MAFVDVIKGLLGKTGEELAAQPGFDFQADSHGLNFYLPKAAFVALQEGRGSTLQKVQLITLRMLEEQGLANPLPNGFMVLEADLAGLEAEQADLLRLPPRSPGLQNNNVAKRNAFERVINLVLPVLQQTQRSDYQNRFLRLMDRLLLSQVLTHSHQ